MSNTGPVLASNLSGQRPFTFGWDGTRGHQLVLRSSACYDSATCAAVDAGMSRKVSISSTTPLQLTTSETLFATAIAGPDLGRIIPVAMWTPTDTNGQPVTANAGYYDLTTTPPTDVTALVTGPNFITLQRPVPFQLGTLSLAVTGTTPFDLGTLNPWTNYAEVAINLDPNAPSGIRWTKDGQAPTATLGEQEAGGGTIKLFDRSELIGFRALSIDGTGALDPLLTTHLTVTFHNISPEVA